MAYTAHWGYLFSMSSVQFVPLAWLVFVLSGTPSGFEIFTTFQNIGLGWFARIEIIKCHSTLISSSCTRCVIMGSNVFF